MIEIRLQRSAWKFDESKRLGPKGGFGEVFLGEGSDGPVAVKRLNLSAADAAHRELAIASVLQVRTLSNIVPILDFGQDAQSDRYYLVMPVCEGSLQDLLKRDGPLPTAEAIQIANEVAVGLAEVGDLVHRDLKPGNILRHDERWAIADFGIAKFVEDVTSLLTLRESLTPQYGAPEQWDGQRPTGATDIYALGCIVHALIRGVPPFAGDHAQLSKAHRIDPPPPLDSGSALLDSLVQTMLRKSPLARPSLQRCMHVFSLAAQEAPKRRHKALAEAELHVSTRLAAEEAARLNAAAIELERNSAAQEANEELVKILDRLAAEIKDLAGSVIVGEREISLGEGLLSFASPKRLNLPDGTELPSRLEKSGWDIIAYGEMSLRVGRLPPPPPRPQPGQVVVQSASTAKKAANRALQIQQLTRYHWSSTLVFAKPPGIAGFRWYEISFSRSNRKPQPQAEPTSLLPTLLEFYQALENAPTNFAIAYGPLPIDAEDENEFFERWTWLLAEAAKGALKRPDQFPISSSYFPV